MSRDRLEEHRRIWEGKPVLADVYAVWFEALLKTLSSRGPVLEVGAGPGFFSAYARQRLHGVHWVAMDIIETPWNDLRGDGQRLPFRGGAFQGIVALDLIHHLASPEGFFIEAVRVLAPGGRIAVIEPWVTPLSYPIYRWLHQEGCRSDIDPWNAFEAGASKEAFEGDAGVFTRLLQGTPPDRWHRLGLRPPQLTVLNGFAYLLSLGFRKRSLIPRRLAPLLLELDRRAATLAPYVGMRVLAVWDCEGPHEHPAAPPWTSVDERGTR